MSHLARRRSAEPHSRFGEVAPIDLGRSRYPDKALIGAERKAREQHRGLSHLTLREEPISDPTLIQHLDRARVKTAGP
jgi:hypothetical protein